MKMKSKNLIVIPARYGSKSIKNKNMKLFCGQPLIYWAIKIGIESKLGPVCVSTDSEEIQKYAISVGAVSPFLRPRKLASDVAPTEPVLKHAYEYFSNAGSEIDTLILLQPTSPFRVVQDLILAMQIFNLDESISSVFSVREAVANQNPHWMLIKNEETSAIEKFNGDKLTNMARRRQDLPKCYIRDDYVYCLRPKNLYQNPSNIYGNYAKLMISSEKRLDIDINTERDWLMGEMLFKFMKENHEKFI
jgi:CMP-N,N'-diacetyllegionaminic acid synthase